MQSIEPIGGQLIMHTRYDEIIIDERRKTLKPQDIVLLRRHASLVSYGADDSQILYPDKATSEKQLMDLFDINKRYFLDENFRNSYQIMLFLKGLFCNNLIYQYILEDLKANGRIGLKPIVIITNNQMDKQKDTIIDIINEYKSDTHTIAILLPKASHVNKHYDFLNTRNIKCTKYHTGVAEAVISNVHVTTFKSSKGVEFDTVIIPGFDKMYKHIDNPEFPM